MLASTEYVALVGDDDKGGDTTAYVNPLSQTIYYVYDDAGRMTTVDFPSGTDTTFTYDNADRNSTMVDSTGTSSWTYDNADRTTQLVTPQGTLTYAYDNAGRRTSMTDSTGTTSYSFDSAGRLSSLTNPHSETTSFTYDTLSRVATQTFANGQYDVFGYDSRSRQTSVTHKKSDASTISTESYSYDYAGNLSSKTVDSVTTNYTYDAIDQLLTESRTGYSATYTYDANGNRASEALGGTTETYSVDDADKLTSVSVGGSAVKTFGYDAAGRRTSMVDASGTTTYAYDYEDRLTLITDPKSATNSFTYNGLDTRVGKTDSGGSKTFRRDGVGVTAPVLSDGSRTYTPGISSRSGSTSTFDVGDYLGSFTRQTSSSQATTATQTFDAFGNYISGTGSPLGPFGYAGGWGYQSDADSGLQLLGHRYYDPTVGRFLTRDPAKDGRNWYTCCLNNPIRFVDAVGLTPIDAAEGAAILAQTELELMEADSLVSPLLARFLMASKQSLEWFMKLPPNVQRVLLAIFGLFEQVGNEAGYGPGAGTAAHSVMEGSIKVGNLRGADVLVEQSYRAQELVSRGASGSVRYDAVVSAGGRIWAILDFKFGKAGLTNSRKGALAGHMPSGWGDPPIVGIGGGLRRPGLR